MDAHVDDGGGGALSVPRLDSISNSLTFFTMPCSVVDHVRGGLKSESSSVKSEVVETMVSMRCLRSPSAEVEVAW